VLHSHADQQQIVNSVNTYLLMPGNRLVVNWIVEFQKKRNSACVGDTACLQARGGQATQLIIYPFARWRF